MICSAFGKFVIYFEQLIMEEQNLYYGHYFLNVACKKFKFFIQVFHSSYIKIQ